MTGEGRDDDAVRGVDLAASLGTIYDGYGASVGPPAAHGTSDELV